MAFASNPPLDASLNKFSIEYSHAELLEMTNVFDPANQLGKGSYGAVFRGIRRDGTEVAIKFLELPDESGFEEEVRVLSKFRHPNLVILMGFARRDSARYLIYEMLAGGDCYVRLQKCHQGQQFTWRERTNAVFDASCGLSHLHHATPKVFHRDIKTANILLDWNGTAKMADFGLSCVSHALAHNVEKTAGTMGYACPLYVKRSVVTEGSEAYSFGVVILEMLTNTCPAVMVKYSDGNQHYKLLVHEVRGSADIAVRMSDERAQWPFDVAVKFAQIALRCVADQEELRPGFAELVHNLRQLRNHAAQEAIRAEDDKRSKESCARILSENRTAINTVRSHISRQKLGLQRSPILQHRIVSPILHHRVVCPSFVPPLAPQPQQPSVAIAPQPRRERLWSLRCTLVHGKSSAIFKEEDTIISHWQELGSPLATTLRVGRMFQEDLFNKLTNGCSSHVSREHFQIWAEELNVSGISERCLEKGVPCSLYLTNYSTNGTLVNGVSINDKCRQVQIHHGDTIAIPMLVEEENGETTVVPRVQFIFDLSGSIIRDRSIGNDIS